MKSVIEVIKIVFILFLIYISTVQYLKLFLSTIVLLLGLVSTRKLAQAKYTKNKICI